MLITPLPPSHACGSGVFAFETHWSYAVKNLECRDLPSIGVFIASLSERLLLEASCKKLRVT